MSAGHESLSHRILTQPCLMVMAKVIKPAQLLNKDPANLRHMMATMIFLVWSLPVAHLGTFNIGIFWGYWIGGKFLVILYGSNRSTIPKLPQESPEHATPLTFREIALSI